MMFFASVLSNVSWFVSKLGKFSNNVLSFVSVSGIGWGEESVEEEEGEHCLY
jgi:hypothetical protein